MAANRFDNIDLDLNSDTVPMNDYKEISMVTESSCTVSIPGTLTEGGTDGVRVSSVGENLLEQRVEGSDVSVKEKLNETEESHVAPITVYEGGGEKSCCGFDLSTSQVFSFSETEVQEVGNEVIGVESITVSSTEVTKVAVEGKIAEMKYEEGLNTRKEVLVNDDVHQKPISPEKNRSMEAAADAGNPKEIAVTDAVLSVGSDEGIYENTTTKQGEKQEPVAEVDKLVSNKVNGDEKMVSHPIEVNMYNNGVPVVDSNSVVKFVNEAVEPLLDKNPKSVQETEAGGSHVAEIVTSMEGKNQTIEVVTVSKEADELYKPDGDQIMGSDFYEVAVSQCYGPSFGSLIVDLGIGPNTDGDEGVKPLDKPLGEKAGVEEIRRDFCVSDLVWGKVKSHPWWPGQIFDPLDSSKLAKKNYKKDRHRLLVAYFGDQTFAWNVASSLKPFGTHFLQMEKQSNLEPFRYAVDSALDEISRRVQLGLACSCTPYEAYDEIKSQIIKNAGIRAESSRRDGVDKKFSVTTFQPAKLLGYIEALALNPRGGVGDQLEFVVAQAQLVAFCRSKGYSQLPEFLSYGGLLVNEGEHPTLILENEEEQASSVKRKLTSEDKVYRKRHKTSDDYSNLIMKERSLSELMGGESGSSKLASHYSGTKHKSFGSFSDDLMGKTNEHRLSQSREDTESQTPTSFKAGEGIRRIASQLKGSSPILSSSEEPQRRKTAIPKEYSSPDEMLSQLHLAARDPMKGYSFLTIIVGFFTDFRNSISLESSSSGRRKVSQMKTDGGKAGAKSRKSSNSKSKAANYETFDYKNLNDSYWTDRIVNGSSEEQSPRKRQKRKGNSKRETPKKKDDITAEPENNLQLNPSAVSEEYRPEIPFQFNYTAGCEQQHPDGNTNLVTEEPVGSLNGNCAQDVSPTALILNFTEADSIPSEVDLNKIFSRFGPLKESETEVFWKTSRAKVVFKRRNDAEVAFSSAGKFSIFGPALASYQLRYLPSTPSKVSSLPATT